MHPYIPHLLEDIAATHQSERRKAPGPVETDASKIIAQLLIKLEEPGHRLGYYCGLSAEQFPPTSQSYGWPNGITDFHTVVDIIKEK